MRSAHPKTMKMSFSRASIPAWQGSDKHGGLSYQDVFPRRERCNTQRSCKER
jgi:hypothetical protein